jgi:AraC-like DNA-binding protein
MSLHASPQLKSSNQMSGTGTSSSIAYADVTWNDTSNHAEVLLRPAGCGSRSVGTNCDSDFISIDLSSVNKRCADLRRAEHLILDSMTLRISRALIFHTQKHSRFEAAHHGVSLCDPVSWEIALALLDMAGERGTISQRSILYIFGLLRTCVLDAQKRVPATCHKTASLAQWQIEKVETALAAGVSTDLSLSQLAGNCRLSICHFARAFKATYGVTVHQYVIAKRIQHARHLLAQSSKSLAQIALDCGFADQSSFSRRFLAVAGESPASWRSSHAIRLLPRHTIKTKQRSRPTHSFEREVLVQGELQCA